MLKSLKRKFSISAPKLSVRPHVPWYIRWALTLPILLITGALIWWAYDSGLELAGFHRSQAEQELSALRERVSALETENANLLNQVAIYERQTQIDHSLNAETTSQIAALNEENTRLKEDLSFFQNLPMSGMRDAELTIHRLKVEPDALPGEYRCRMLLVQSVQQRGKEFQGRLQFLVNGEQDGKKIVLQFPQDTPEEISAYQLNFKYYQRVDRIVKLPPDMRIDTIQVRVFEKGITEPKVKMAVGLS